MFKSFKLSRVVIGVLTACSAVSSYAGVVTTEGQDIILKTDGGFSARTADNQFSFNVTGRINLDTSYSTGVLNNATNDKSRTDTYIRRGYFGITGTAYKDWYYEMIINGYGDLGADSQLDWDTFYLQYRGLPWFDVMLGRAVRPFGLEQSISSGATSTIERAAVSDLTNATNTETSQQLQFSKGYDHMSWAVSVYDNGNTTQSKNTRYGYDGRITVAPIVSKTEVLHLGLSVDDANIDQGTYTAKSTLGAKKSDGIKFATGNFKADRSGIVELAYMNGPFSLQGEYLKRDLSAADSATKDADVQAYYLMGTYTLTGESRGYSAKSGKFSNISPSRKSGAWELVGRYEHIETDQLLTKEADVFLLGVNWYANKNVKLMFNLQSIKTDNVAAADRDDTGKSASMRLQYNF